MHDKYFEFVPQVLVQQAKLLDWKAWLRFELFTPSYFCINFQVIVNYWKQQLFIKTVYVNIGLIK